MINAKRMRRRTSRADKILQIKRERQIYRWMLKESKRCKNNMVVSYYGDVEGHEYDEPFKKRLLGLGYRITELYGQYEISWANKESVEEN